MKALEEQWKMYKEACYPSKNGKITPLQESELRQSFFAGCLVVLEFAVENTQGLSPESKVQYVSALIFEAQEVCRERIYEMKGRN